jgi:tetratricopeptide (TPR) repeat protein
MKLFVRSPKQGQILEDNPTVDPGAMEQPANSASYLQRGYAYYGVNQYAEAVEDFHKALDLDPKAVDAVYGLGMGLKAEGKKDEAVAAFKNAIALLDQGVVSDKVRARILRRLALGHVNEMTRGDWNLEAEIWQRVT